jgi:hypothetical protein
MTATTIRATRAPSTKDKRVNPATASRKRLKQTENRRDDMPAATPRPAAGAARRRRRATRPPEAPVPLLDEPPPIDWDAEDWTLDGM